MAQCRREMIKPQGGGSEMRVFIGRTLSVLHDAARGLRSLRLPLPHQPSCFGNLGRRHSWPLVRQFVSNGIE